MRIANGRPRQLLGLLALLVWLPPGAAVAQGTPAASQQAPELARAEVELEVYSAPRLEQFRPVPYPAEALGEGREGWVIVNLMVDPAGKPYEIGIVDSLGGREFEKAAVRSVEKSVFRAARLGDRTIDAGYVFKLTFARGAPATGATRPFRTTYKRLMNAVNAGDRAAADAAAEALNPQNLYEAAYFNLGMYGYHRKWGTVAQQIEALKGAIAGEDRSKYLPRAEFTAVLTELLRMQVGRNDLGGALESWRRLKPLASPAQVSLVKPVIDEIERLQHRDTPVPLDDEIARSGSWFNTLFRRRFQIVVHSGHVSDIKLRCEKSYVLFHYEPAIEYSVKGRDGQCVIELVGEPGSRFTLVQT